jgi:hypothetical protein
MRVRFDTVLQMSEGPGSADALGKAEAHDKGGACVGQVLLCYRLGKVKTLPDMAVAGNVR